MKAFYQTMNRNGTENHIILEWLVLFLVYLRMRKFCATETSMWLYRFLSMKKFSLKIQCSIEQKNRKREREREKYCSVIMSILFAYSEQMLFKHTTNQCTTSALAFSVIMYSGASIPSHSIDPFLVALMTIYLCWFAYTFAVDNACYVSNQRATVWRLLWISDLTISASHTLWLSALSFSLSVYSPLYLCASMYIRIFS